MASVQVQGRNWIVALGRGLDALGSALDISRLACEVLPNGKVIARDIATGTGYIVQDLDADEDGFSASMAPTQLSEALEVFGEAPDEEEADEATLCEVEDEPGEPIFELPADAITELESEDSLPIGAVRGAQTEVRACELSLGEALTRVPAESGAVILAERGYLRFAAARGPHARKLIGVRLPTGTGVAGFAMEKRRTVLLANAHADPRHCGEVDALTGYETRAIAVIPVVHGDRVFGVLELMNLQDAARFEEHQVDAVQEVVDRLAARLAR